MKITISLLISFLLATTVCYGQSKNQLRDLYNECIEKHLLKEHLEKAIFLEDNMPGGSQSAKAVIDSSKVSFWDWGNYNKAELKKGMDLLMFHPPVLKDDTLSITIENRLVSKKLFVMTEI